MKSALGGIMKLPELEQGRTVTVDTEHGPGLLLVTGIGVINTAFTIGQALQVHAPELVMLAGIAGTFDPERFPLGSAAMVRTEIWPEYGLKTGNEVDPVKLGFSLGEVDQKPVWDRVNLLSGKNLVNSGLDRLSKLPEAVSLTVSGVTATGEAAERYRTVYSADLENMEGFAAAYGAALAGVDICELRAVSNIVGSRESGDWDLKGALAALGRTCSVLFR